MLTQRFVESAGPDGHAARQHRAVEEGGHTDAPLEDEPLLAPEPAVGRGVARAVVRGEYNEGILVSA
jgi:hypothetical protein